MKLEKIVLWLLPWYPVSYVYTIGKIPLGLIIYAPLLLVMLYKKKKLIIEPSLRYLFCILLIVVCVQLLLPYTDSTTIFHILIPTIIYMLTIVCVVNYVNLKELMTPYVVVSIVYMLGLLYQAIQLFVWYVPITGPIAIFPDLVSTSNVVNSEIFRPMSFFQEPQAYATWMVPFVIIMIEKKSFILALLASISVLLCASTEGLVLIAVVWLLFMISYKSSFWLKLLILSVIAFLIFQYMTSEIFSIGLNKATNTDYGESKRLTQGFQILGRMDFIGWLFGMGTAINRFYIDFARSINVGIEELYFSSATGVFINYGFFVGVAYWYFLLKKVKMKYRSLFIYSICLCIIPFAQTAFFTPAFVYLISLYYLLFEYCIDSENASLEKLKLDNRT